MSIRARAGRRGPWGRSEPTSPSDKIRRHDRNRPAGQAWTGHGRLQLAEPRLGHRRAAAAAGAELAFSYQGERLKADLEKLTRDWPGTRLSQCDVTNEDELKGTFAGLREAWGSLDFVVHSIAFAPRAAMDGRYIETTRDDWRTALEISAYSLVAVAREAEPLLGEGGRARHPHLLRGREGGPQVQRHGHRQERPGGERPLSRLRDGEEGRAGQRRLGRPGAHRGGAAIPGFMKMYNKVGGIAPLGRNVTHEEVGNLGLFLLSPLASGITGETVYVDAGFHIMGMELGED